eukprot:1429545-Prymnesium_polylepis.1
MWHMLPPLLFCCVNNVTGKRTRRAPGSLTRRQAIYGRGSAAAHAAALAEDVPMQAQRSQCPPQAPR